MIPHTIYGLHDPPPVSRLAEFVPLWIVFPVGVGKDPHNVSGLAGAAPYKAAGCGIIARTTVDWSGGGCIPERQYYADYAQRCANFASASPDVDVIVIGNEPNHVVERPHAQPILAASYADCFNRCYAAIKAVRPQVQVVPAAIAPWYTDAYDSDWIAYQFDMLVQIDQCDGLCIHAYTHGADPALIQSLDEMATWPGRYYHFQHYRQLLDATPMRYDALPIYITETDQTDPWTDINSGWVQAAYAEIDDWNQAHTQQIRCGCLYRWGAFDRWDMSNKPGVIDDFKAAIACGYTWTEEEPDMPEWKIIHQNKCELGFHDQQGIGELTVPNGTSVHWIQGSAQGDHNRVEADHKTLPQTEVYEGVNSAALMWRYSTGSAALVSDPIYIEAGKPVRGSCMYQHVFDGGNGGARMGIVVGGSTDPFGAGKYTWPKNETSPFAAGCIAWGGWRSTYSGNLANRLWAKLDTPEVVPAGAYVRFICQFNADDPAISSAGILDVMTVEQYTDATTPQPEPEPEPTPGACVGLTAEKLARAIEALVADLRMP